MEPVFSDEVLKGISDAFLASCEERSLFPWRYYYVKYGAFRPGSYGKYSNSKAETAPYQFSVMQTPQQWSPNTYMPYLKEADPAHLSRESFGQRLVYGDRYITCANSAYYLKDSETEQTIETVPIPQNEDGIDTEDRILLLKRYIESSGL